MTTRIGAALLGVALLTAACGGRNEEAATGQAAATDEERAAATLGEMLAVAEAGDWGAYVDRFYGEKGKFRSPADRDALVTRFAERRGEKVVAVLRVAVTAKVRIDGDRALFEKDGKTLFVLHPFGDGWAFHL